MKRALVTGASGFVGSNLARRLLGDGHELHLLLRPDHDPWRIADLRPHARIHLADLHDASAVKRAVQAVKPDWVFHLAVHGAYSDQTDWERMMGTNILGTAHLVHACLETGVEAFVNTGSSSEYGHKDHAPDESETIEPGSHYAVTKAAATHFCRYTARTHGLHLPTLRLYSVYGPFEEPRRLMPTLVVHALERRWPRLVSPNVARDFVYTEDVVDAYLRAAATRGVEPGAVYNIGSGTQTSIGELAKIARDLFEIGAEPDWGSMPDRAWDTHVWISDPRKAERELGWSARCSLADGLRGLASWLQDDPARVERYRRSAGLAVA
jgi:nucleoside-diphosphate-sugar epimerase